MRGKPSKQSTMLSLRTPEERIPADHPLRRIKDMADAALATLSPTFEKMYSGMGRPSIPPEQLLKATLLMAFYSVRSERLFCEQLDYNLLFRWFLDLGIEEPSFDHSTFSANRQRLLEHDVAKQFFVAIVEQARKVGLMSNEHFTVDGTLIEAWASLKSFRLKEEKKRPPPDDPGNPTVNFKGGKAQQPNARVEDRPGCAVGAERRWQRGEVELFGECVDGESARAIGRHLRRIGGWRSGTARCGRNVVRVGSRKTAHHRRWRQRL